MKACRVPLRLAHSVRDALRTPVAFQQEPPTTQPATVENSRSRPRLDVRKRLGLVLRQRIGVVRERRGCAPGTVLRDHRNMDAGPQFIADMYLVRPSSDSTQRDG